MVSAAASQVFITNYVVDLHTMACGLPGVPYPSLRNVAIACIFKVDLALLVTPQGNMNVD